MDYDTVIASAHGWGDSDDDQSIDKVLFDLRKNGKSHLLSNLNQQLLLEKLELVEAYVKTLYWVEEFDFPIRIGRYSYEAHKIAAKINQTRASRKGLLLLSAHNPRGIIKDGAWNAKRQAALSAEMSGRELSLGYGKGISLTPNDQFVLHWESFCMIGPITEEDALELCRQYGQIASVFTGTLEPTKLIFSGLLPE